MDNQEKYEAWLTEDFLLDEICRNPDHEQKLLNLYDYLMLQKDFEDEVEDNQE